MVTLGRSRSQRKRTALGGDRRLDTHVCPCFAAGQYLPVAGVPLDVPVAVLFSGAESDVLLPGKRRTAQARCRARRLHPRLPEGWRGGPWQRWRRCTTRPTRSCSHSPAWSKTCCAVSWPVCVWTTSTSRRCRSCRPSTSATSCSGGTAMPCGGSGCAGAGCIWWCCSSSSRGTSPGWPCASSPTRALLYEELVRNGAVASGEPLPPVLPLVLYNGARPWRVAREMGELIAAVGPELARFSAGAAVPRG